MRASLRSWTSVLKPALALILCTAPQASSAFQLAPAFAAATRHPAGFGRPVAASPISPQHPTVWGRRRALSMCAPMGAPDVQETVQAKEVGGASRTALRQLAVLSDDKGLSLGNVDPFPSVDGGGAFLRLRLFVAPRFQAKLPPIPHQTDRHDCPGQNNIRNALGTDPHEKFPRLWASSSHARSSHPSTSAAPASTSVSSPPRIRQRE